MEKPKVSNAQLIYGDIVYWLCVAAALICTVGPVIAMAGVENNVLNPHYLFSAIWEGKNAEEIWSANGGSYPGGHFWLDHFTLGDGFTQFGLVLGGAVALPALLAAAIAFLMDKPRQYFWAVMALWVSTLVAISVVGLISAGH